MAVSLRTRVGIVCVLLVAQFGLLVWYGSLDPAPGAGDYPGAYELGMDYEGHIGERVALAGRVVETDPVVIETNAAGTTLRLTVQGVTDPVEHGDKLRVFGEVREGNVLVAHDAFVVPEAGLWYTWGASLLAGLWALLRLLHDWRLDTERWVLVRASAASGGSARGGGKVDA